jgi:hypothetical protein
MNKLPFMPQASGRIFGKAKQNEKGLEDADL